MDGMKARYERRQPAYNLLLIKALSHLVLSAIALSVFWVHCYSGGMALLDSSTLRVLRKLEDIEARDNLLQSLYSRVVQEEKKSSGSTLEYNKTSQSDEIDIEKKVLRKLEDIEARDNLLQSAFDHSAMMEFVRLFMKLDDIEARDERLQSPFSGLSWELEDIKARYETCLSAYSSVDQPMETNWTAPTLHRISFKDWPDFDESSSPDSEDIETGDKPDHDSLQSPYRRRRVTRKERKIKPYKWSTTTKKKLPDFVDPASSHLEENIVPAEVDSLEPAGRGVSLKRKASSGHSKQNMSPHRDIDF